MGDGDADGAGATWSLGGYGVVILRLNFVGIAALVSQITTVHTHSHTPYIGMHIFRILHPLLQFDLRSFPISFVLAPFLFEYPWKQQKLKKRYFSLVT